MKAFAILLLTWVVSTSPLLSQVILTSGPAAGSLSLVPLNAACLNTNPQTVPVCNGGVNASFAFTANQCCSCPTSGKICSPGSVAYGGSGSSASFVNYHTLSYSPSNEHQRVSFDQPITTFQFSTSGPASGTGEFFRIDIYLGANFLNSVQFFCPGPGLNNTYHLSGANFDRLEFQEINAVSADDELMGDFYINSQSCGVFPFELLSFTGELNAQEQVDLFWETQHEVDNDYFLVERSADGQNWEELSRVPGAGSSEKVQNYNSLDPFPFTGMSYYRLKQVDFNGDFHLSNLISVNIHEGKEEVLVYPNPATDLLKFHFGNRQGALQLQVFDHLGKEVKSLSASTAMTSLDITDLSPGLYLIRVVHEGRSSNHRIKKL